MNCILIPIVVILFFVTELIFFVFLRILADYANVEAGQSFYFYGNFALYWGVLILMVEAYFIFQFIKDLLLNMIVLANDTEIHKKMIESLLHSPLSFFYQTPSGALMNKFTTDINMLDNVLVVAVVESLEGIVLVCVVIFNLVWISAFFAIAAVVVFFVGILLFLYAQDPIMACKQLDLQDKGPVFQALSETVNNLIQIRLCNLRQSKVGEFADIMNKTVKATIAYEYVERAFDFY
jgi:ATP-binding cassette, subfamily C (CFTR/MRP), member 4